MSSATFYKRRSKYGGMDASLMTRMKELEDENRRLKKVYVEVREAEKNGHQCFDKLETEVSNEAKNSKGGIQQRFERHISEPEKCMVRNG